MYEKSSLPLSRAVSVTNENPTRHEGSVIMSVINKKKLALPGSVPLNAESVDSLLKRGGGRTFIVQGEMLRVWLVVEGAARGNWKTELVYGLQLRLHL